MMWCVLFVGSPATVTWTLSITLSRFYFLKFRGMFKMWLMGVFKMWKICILVELVSVQTSFFQHLYHSFNPCGTHWFHLHYTTVLDFFYFATAGTNFYKQPSIKSRDNTWYKSGDWKSQTWIWQTGKNTGWKMGDVKRADQEIETWKWQTWKWQTRVE